MDTKKFKILEIIGVFFTYLFAVVLHFVYDLTSGSVLSIVFGAVNESVWEHIKIFAVGFILWAFIELMWVKPPFRQFVVAKTLSLYILLISITVFFYTYNIFTDKPILVLDIISSVIFVILCYYMSYRLVTEDSNLKDYFLVAIMLLMMFFVMFFSFTLFPPKLDLFKDPVTDMYGIIDENIDVGAVFLDKTQ